MGLFLCPKEVKRVPRKPKRPCSFPGCPNLTDGRFQATTKETEYKEQLEKLRKVNAVELALLAGENKPQRAETLRGG